MVSDVLKAFWISRNIVARTKRNRFIQLYIELFCVTLKRGNADFSAKAATPV